MGQLAARNRYLVNASGRFVGDRTVAAFVFFGPLVGSFVIGFVGTLVGQLTNIPAIAGLSVLVAVVLFFGAVVAQWVFLFGGSSSVAQGSSLAMSGNTQAAIPLLQKPLGRVFRADVRTRALYTLGLCAESHGDFAEAEDLFDRAAKMIPAMAAGKWQRHGRVMMGSHRAIALVALNRLDEADMLVRMASAQFPPRPPGALDVLSDDAAFGAVGISAALRDLEPGRDPRALLTLASVVVLAARGMAREAVELVERERYFLNAGLLPRERALVAHVENRSRGLLAGGPMRSPGMQQHQQVDPAGEAWAQKVLPSR